MATADPEAISEDDKDEDEDEDESQSDYEYVDAADPEEESMKMSDKEIFEISKKMSARDGYTFGIAIGFSKPQMDNLKYIHPDDPEMQVFEMLSSWCTKVSELQLNARQQLALQLEAEGRRDLANMTDCCYKDACPSKKIHEYIQKISFYKGNQVQSTSYSEPRRPSSEYGHRKQSFYNSRGQYGLSRDQRNTASSNNQGFEKLKQPSQSIAASNKAETLTSVEYLQIDDRKKNVEEIVKSLALTNFFPGKISLQDVRSIKDRELPLSMNSMPWLILNKIIMMNYNAREEDLDKFYEKSSQSPIFGDDVPDEDIFEDTEPDSNLNPMDLFLVLFLASDVILQQEIMSKMFMCRLAVPLGFRDSDNKLVWAKESVRRIVINQHVENKSSSIDALHGKCKIVSFVGIGVRSLSKSKVINSLLNNQYHPTFFNKDCPLGTSKRMIAAGTVEATWYIPSHKQTDLFQDFLLILNLRGDCLEHKEELNLISRMSNVIIVHTNVENLMRTEVKEALRALYSYPQLFVVYALEADEKPKCSPKEIIRNFKSEKNVFKDRMKFLNLKAGHTKSASDITKELRQIISDNIIRAEMSALSDHIQFKANQSLGVTKLADNVLEVLTCQPNAPKEVYLPLQSKPWHEWSIACKTFRRSKSIDDRSRVETELKKKRLTQYNMQRKINPLMHKFCTHLIELLKKNNTLEICQYIERLIVHLNERSRKILPKLIQAYQGSWLRMKSAKEGNKKEYDTLLEIVEQQENELVAASFGFEHLMRELGQMYESNVHFKKSTVVGTKLYLRLFVEFACTILQQGYPFEILDGDTGMVPIIWIKAVLKQLHRNIGNNKLLAISVLGIQSSGKSTLLNAMFGLKFPVSAGRCTRGVYIQLVKVTTRSLPFSYVLVIDTEGLRAPELSAKNYSHDNELATFVLGLGNITIINIKGENTTEIENVLQIAVHAFLRLKMANGRLKMQQTCIFAHQNVSAPDASTAIAHARQKMIDKLDRITVEAAKQEGLQDIQSFNNVIETDPISHIWYFSDLHSGDPPMAPINIGYSQKVQEVKQHILYDIAVKKRTFLTVSETMDRIEDLWDGILSDDFVFSFRNSLEMQAHRSIESKFRKLTLSIEEQMFTFINRKARVKLARCSSNEDLEMEYKRLVEDFEKMLDDNLKYCLDQWNNYIDSSSLKDIMEQWRENRNIKIREYVLEFRDDGKKLIQQHKRNYAANLAQTDKRADLEAELRRKAKQYAEMYEAKNEKILLTKIFDDTWQEWIGDQVNVCEPDDKVIENEVERVLFEQLPSDGPFIQKRLKTRYDLEPSYPKTKQIEGTFLCTDIEDEDISIPYDIKQTRETMLSIKRQLVDKINVIFAKIDSKIREIISEDSPFERKRVGRIFMIVRESIEEFNAQAEGMKQIGFTAGLRVKLALHIKRYTTDVFTFLSKRYKKSHDLEIKLENYKVLAFEQFSYLIAKEHNGLKLANAIIGAVEKLIHEEIEKRLPKEIEKVIIGGRFWTKQSMMLTMLKDLAEKREFKQFYWYIQDVESFAKDWITNFTKKQIAKRPSRGESSYERIIKVLVDEYCSTLQECVDLAEKVCKQTLNPTMKTWVTQFEQNLSRTIPVPINMLGFFKTFDVPNYKVVAGRFRIQVKELHTTSIKTFTSKDINNIIWKGQNPYVAIFEKLWGCTSKCPFCHEVCQKTTAHSSVEPHTCIQHRPPGLRGVHYKTSLKMSWETCHYKVFSDTIRFSHYVCKLNSGVCNEKDEDGELFHPYRSYQKYFPNWIIEPSSTKECSAYWKWFTYTYQKDLIKAYGYIIPENVNEWKSISRKEAIQSLDSSHPRAVKKSPMASLFYKRK